MNSPKLSGVERHLAFFLLAILFALFSPGIWIFFSDHASDQHSFKSEEQQVADREKLSQKNIEKKTLPSRVKDDTVKTEGKHKRIHTLNVQPS